MKRAEPIRKPVLIDRGIVKIERGPSPPRAPSGPADLAPPMATPRSRLDELYAESGLDGYMHQMLWVPPRDTALLTPAVFRAVLEEAPAAMKREAAAAEGSAQRTLGEAAKVLADQQERVDLLGAYLTALLPG